MALHGNQAFPVQYGKFSLLRSYVSELWISSYHDFVFTQTDNSFSAIIPAVPDYLYIFVIDERFWDWSSNTYTLDVVVKYAYRHYTPTGDEIPIDVAISWRRDAVENRSSLYLQSYDAGMNERVVMPAATGPYWTPDAEGFPLT